MRKPAGCLIALIAMIVVLFGVHPPVYAETKDIRIADSKGDWGYPNPYRHYPRGPG